MYIYIYIYIFICYHENKTMCLPGCHHNGLVASHAHDVRLHIAGTNQPKSTQQAKQEA